MVEPPARIGANKLRMIPPLDLVSYVMGTGVMRTYTWKSGIILEQTSWLERPQDSMTNATPEQME